jgi:tripartite-type tricarboxylate transporter receptor subunit TctC
MAAAGVALPNPARAAWPERPLRPLCAFPPGSATDIAPRAVAEALAGPLGQPVLMENRGGASGNIATVAVRNTADGHTALVHGVAFAVNPALSANPGFAITDFRTIAILGATPATFVVKADGPIRNLTDLLAAARARPLDYASSGAGTVPRLGAELLFRRLAQVEVRHVAFAPAQAVTAVVSGHVPLGVVALPTAMGLVRSGQLRIIAVDSAGRDLLLPNKPTVAKQECPWLDVSAWSALFVPRIIPADVARRLAAECGRLLAAPKLRTRLALAGLTPGAPGRGDRPGADLPRPAEEERADASARGPRAAAAAAWYAHTLATLRVQRTRLRRLKRTAHAWSRRAAGTLLDNPHRTLEIHRLQGLRLRAAVRSAGPRG